MLTVACRVYLCLLLLSTIAVALPQIDLLAGRNWNVNLNTLNINAQLSQPIGSAYDSVNNLLYVCDVDTNTVKVSNLLTNITSVFAGNGYSGDGGLATNAQLRNPYSCAIDNVNNLVYISDFGNNLIREVNRTSGMIRTVVGTGVGATSNDGTIATSANIQKPACLALDPKRNLLIFSEELLHTVRAWNRTSNKVFSIAGIATQSGYTGNGGNATSAKLCNPWGMYVDSNDTLWLTELCNHVVRTINLNTNIINVYAGGNGAGYFGDGGLAINAKFNTVCDVYLDEINKLLYLSDYQNYCVRVVNITTNIVTTIAGTGVSGYPLDGGLANQTTFGLTNRLSFDRSRNLMYVVDKSNQVVKAIDLKTNIVSTVVGGPVSYQGSASNIRNTGLIYGAKLDSARNLLYYSDFDKHVIRVIDLGTNNVRTVAGVGYYGLSADNVTALSPIKNPTGIAVDSARNLVYFNEWTNHIVRVLNMTSGTMSRVTGTGTCGYSGDNGPAILATICSPHSLVLDPVQSILYISFHNSHTIRAISLQTGIITLFAGTGVAGYNETGPATSTPLRTPGPMSIDFTNNLLYFVEFANNVVRVVNRATGVISRVAGTPSVYSYTGDGGRPLSSTFMQPFCVTFDPFNNLLYVCDLDANIIRSIDLTKNVINRIGGKLSTSTSTGDGDLLGRSTFNSPVYIEYDPIANKMYTCERFGVRVVTDNTIVNTVVGNWSIFSPATAYNTQPSGVQGVYLDERRKLLYVFDTADMVIRQVNLVTESMTVFAGRGIRGYTGDGYLATNATFSEPRHAQIDPNTNVMYVSEFANSVIRQIDLNTGIITTYAGNGAIGYTADGNKALNNPLNRPGGLALDLNLNVLYYTEEGPSHLLRYINRTNGNIYTVAGIYGQSGYSSTPVVANSSKLNYPWGVTIDYVNNLLYISELVGSVRFVNRTNGLLYAFAGTGVDGYSGDGGNALNAQMRSPCDTAVDYVRKRVYIADHNNLVLRMVNYVTNNISLLAGTPTMTGIGADYVPATSIKMGRPNRFALDANNSQLYWADYFTNSVKQLDLNTNKIRTIFDFMASLLIWLMT
ncbi:NHL repeat-containing protein [Acrasis kona]|uniref:NHL repeat-containing protein n=1 Tax=Acrasis kona TaxID=1008807 RepID=A0AAW2YUE3_9EUKA